MKGDCDHGGTDGTVDCRACKITAAEFIKYAAEYLDGHARAESYFSGYLIGNPNLPTDKRQLVQTDWEFPSTAVDLGWSLTRVQRRGDEIVHLARRPKLS